MLPVINANSAQTPISPAKLEQASASIARKITDLLNGAGIDDAEEVAQSSSSPGVSSYRRSAGTGRPVSRSSLTTEYEVSPKVSPGRIRPLTKASSRASLKIDSPTENSPKSANSPSPSRMNTKSVPLSVIGRNTSSGNLPPNRVSPMSGVSPTTKSPVAPNPRISIEGTTRSTRRDGTASSVLQSTLRENPMSLSAADQETFEGFVQRLLPDDRFDEPSSEHYVEQCQSERTIHVYVSSTFNDCSPDRDALNRTLFPRLHELCALKGIQLVPVDLRRGIGSEEGCNPTFLLSSLKEIVRCRPYFISLIGNSYGWRQDEDAPTDERLSLVFDKAAESFPWVNQFRNRSLFEIEVLFGALNRRHRDPKRNLFYTRNIPQSDNSPTTNAADQHAGAVVVRRSPGAHHRRSVAAVDDGSHLGHIRILALKHVIKKAGFPMRSGYESLTELCEQVYGDLHKAIMADFPDAQPLARIDYPTLANEAFGKSRRRIYVPRPHYEQQIDSHVDSTGGRCMCIVGPTGSGKTALMANWCHARKTRVTNISDLVLIYHVGGPSHSTSFHTMIKYLCTELAAFCTLDDALPLSTKELVQVFRELVYRSASTAPSVSVVIVIDGVNDLELNEALDGLRWLPHSIPPNVAIILTSTPGQVVDAFREHRWPVLELQPLIPSEKERIIEAFSLPSSSISATPVRSSSPSPQSQNHDRLPEKTLFLRASLVFVDNAATGNVLFLRTLMEEVRRLGADTAFKLYSRAATSVDLYVLVLQRWEAELGEDLMRGIFQYLAASREGLTEAEMIELLYVSASVWSPAFFVLCDWLVVQGGLHFLCHQVLREAGWKRYIEPDPNTLPRCHRMLADFFEKRAPSERRNRELPYQLAKAHDWARLLLFVTDVKNFLRLHTMAKEELMEYCVAIMNSVADGGPALDIVGAINNMLTIFLRDGAPSDEVETANVLDAGGEVLAGLGKYTAAVPLFTRALAVREQAQGASHPAVASTVIRLAEAHVAMEELDTAVGLVEKALKIRSVCLGPEHIDMACTHELAATLYRRCGNLDQALAHFVRACDVVEKTLGPKDRNVAPRLQKLAEMYKATGQSDKALPLLRRAQSILEQNVQSDHLDLAWTFQQMGEVFASQQQCDAPAAGSLFDKALNIRMIVLGPDAELVGETLKSIADLHRSQNRLNQSVPFYLKSLDVLEKTKGENHEDVAKQLLFIADLYRKGLQYDSALEAYLKALAVYEKVGGRNNSSLIPILQSISGIYVQKDRVADAVPLLERMVGLQEASGGPQSAPLASSLSTLGDSLITMGNFDDAQRVLQQSLAILETNCGPVHQDIAKVLSSLASIYVKKERLDDALEMQSRSVSISEQCLEAYHPALAVRLSDLARMYQMKKKYLLGIQTCERAIKIQEMRLDATHPDRAKAQELLTRLKAQYEKWNDAQSKKRRGGVRIGFMTKGPLPTGGGGILVNNRLPPPGSPNRPKSPAKGV